MTRARWIVFVFALLLSFAIFGAWWLMRETRTASWTSKSSAQLRALFAAVVIADNELDEPPASTWALIHLNYLSPERLITPYSDLTMDSLTVGNRRWVDVASSADFDDLSPFFATLPSRGSNWEVLGDFLLAPDAWTLRASGESPVVFGVTRPSPFDHDVRIVLYNDGSSSEVHDATWWATDNATRLRVGRSPLPAVP